MKPCDICKVKYPEEILWADICGICALKQSNEIHGANRKQFDGDMAEEMRQAAIEHRRKVKA